MNYVLDNTAEGLYINQYNHREDYNNIIVWLYSLNNKNLNNNINTTVTSYGNNSTIKDGTYKIIHNKCLIIVEAGHLGLDQETSIYKEIKINILGSNNKTIIKDAYKTIKIDSESCIQLERRNGQPVSIAKRKLDTIFSDQFDEINNLIIKWKDQQDVFREHGMAFKTGILLHGVPGTGKTSIVRAIATEFNMNIMYVNVATIKAQDIDYINIRNNSILLLEEIDLMKDDEDYKKKVSSLLSLLDGITSPNNCIIIATSNYIDAIDERLVRKGRFDNIIEVTNICRHTAIRMCESFNIDPVLVLEEGKKSFNPSELQDKILKII